MNTRKALITLGAITVGLTAPIVSMADITWITTNDEAGTRIVQTASGSAPAASVQPASKPLQAGDLSADRQYVFVGGEGGWELRPMSYRFENGRFVHVDDPVGHMHRQADSRPLTEQQRIALERSSGS
ncbi:MAG: hypothetical protein KIS74_00755 [Burkholderiales bacterium]|nr:hypothetical protein [Burkholderiales bacterium]